MMKQKPLILGLLLLLLSPSSKAELKVHFTREVPQQLQLQKVATEFWFSEEQYWKVVPVEKEIEVDFSLVSTNHLAQTRGNRINFNFYTEASDQSSTLRHELAHIFLNSQCPRLSDLFTQELFAYWRSDDYLRLLYRTKKIFTKAEAIQELKSPSSFNETKALAVARLINEIVKKDKDELLKTWFEDLFRQCRDEAYLKNQNLLLSGLISKIQGYVDKKSTSDAFGFLVFDSLANETIEADGRWKLKQVVGSTLKPFLVTFFSDLKKKKNKRLATEWECGDQERKSWDLSGALNYSCNGFFLDSKFSSLEFNKYVETLNALTQSQYQSRWLNMADAIGLWPSLKLNLQDVARIYDYILETDTKTIEILKKTASRGTLAGAPDSTWFVDHQVALKSGTTTGFDLAVENGFVVAVFQSGSVSKIAILYRASQRPIDLLPELKSRIAKYVQHKDSQARVQVLSRFNADSVEISCPTMLLKNGKQIKETGLTISRKHFKGGTLSCVGSAFDVTAADKVSRRLYGDLTLLDVPQPVAKVEDARSEKNARARKGSQLILNTSEWHYLKNVFFSETQDYRLELKKAMLLVIKNNLAFWQLKKQPICDTTICQVFNLGYEAVPDSKKKSVNHLILEMGSLNLGFPKWLEFSFGGQEPWQQKVENSEIFEFLKSNPSKLFSGSKSKDQFTFQSEEGIPSRFSCEVVRSFFKLRSCPDSFNFSGSGESIFFGRGEGHERGMDLTEANQLAIQGYNFDQIIENYYDLKVQSK